MRRRANSAAVRGWLVILLPLVLAGCGRESAVDEGSVSPSPQRASLSFESQPLSERTRNTDCNLPPDSGEQDIPVDLFNVPRNDEIRVVIRYPVNLVHDSTLYVLSETPDIFQTRSVPDGRIGRVQLIVPMGSHLSEPFIIEGKSIDKGTLFISETREIPSESNPDDDLVAGEFTTDVIVWDFEEDQIVDYNAMGDFDPNAMSDSDNRCYQGGPSAPALKSDMAKRVDCGTKADAVAADGASLQLVRAKAGGFGKFCLTFPGGDPAAGTRAEYYGKFSDPIAGGSSTASPATNVDAIAYQSPDEPGVQYWGLGTYTPPTDFFENGATEREVEVEVQFAALKGPGIPTRSHITAVKGKKIKIRRPPVLLVHGLWSNSQTWAKAFKSPNPARLVEGKFSYNGSLPYTRLLARDEPVERLDARISDLVVRARKGGKGVPKVATTKVDLIAHSMGGLYSRQWINSANYRNPSQFGQGNVRRLATLTTPHMGARLANALVNLHQNFFNTETGEHDTRLSLLETGLDVAQDGDVHQGAVCELVENSSALESGSTSGVRALAYVASGGPQFDWAPGLRVLLWTLFSQEQRQAHTDPYIYSGGNDGIVSRFSQIGGLPVGHEFPDYYHSSGLGFGGTVTGSEDVALRIYRDLDTPGSWLDPMPGFAVEPGMTGVPFFGGRGQEIDSANVAQQCDQQTGPMYQFGRP